MPFNIRKKKNMKGKQKIAELIGGLVHDGDHIILDPSTTAVSIVKMLKDRKRLTIITNSIEVLVELTDVNGWEVISTGGTLKENYLALVGARAMQGIASFHADKAIFSCKGIAMDKGVTDANELFSQVKQTMLRSAAQRILAVDHTKFDKVAFSQICDISDIDLIVTDLKPSDAWMSYFAEKNITCLYGEETE